MKYYCKADENGNIIAKASGFQENPLSGGIEINVTPYVFERLEDYQLIDGELVVKPSTSQEKTPEQRIAELEIIIDAILNGGAAE